MYPYIILLIVRLVNTVNKFERAIFMAENTIPNDPMILLSFVNTKLRDFYPSLDKMCDDLGCNKEEIESKLSAIDYKYNAELNKFV